MDIPSPEIPPGPVCGATIKRKGISEHCPRLAEGGVAQQGSATSVANANISSAVLRVICFLRFFSSADNEKGRGSFSDQRPPSASVSPIRLNCCLRKLHFFPDNISDHRHAILDLQFFDLPMS